MVRLEGEHLVYALARKNFPLTRLNEITEGGALAWLFVVRKDCSLDRLSELTGSNLAFVMTHRKDCPLDRIDELSPHNLAKVLASRLDCPLDRIGRLRGYDLEMVQKARGISPKNSGIVDAKDT